VSTGSATVSVLSSLQLPGSRRMRALQLLGASLLIALLAHLLLAQAPPPAGPGVQRIDSAEVRVTPSAGAAATPFADTALPLDCPPEGDSWRCERRLRVLLRLPAALATDSGTFGPALYVPSFVGALRVRLDGMLLADSRLDQWETSSLRSAPLLVPLPRALLRPEGNVLELELLSRIAAGGRLEPFFVGEDDLLRPHHDRTRLGVVTLPRMFEGALLAMALGALALWLLRRHDPLYLLFGLMLLMSSATALPSILLEAPGDLALHAANMGRLLGGALALPFAWRLVGREPPIRTTAFLLLPALALATAIMLPGPTSASLIRYLYAPILVVLCAMAVWTVFSCALAERSDAALLFVAAMAMPVLPGVLAILSENGGLDMRMLMTLRAYGPLLATVMGLILIWHYARTLATLEHFNQRLRQAIDEAVGRERAAAAREQAQTRRIALEAERVRLMSDLHDGLAGQLMSILSLSEQAGGSADRRIGDAARRALADLRLVVASLEDMGGDLGVMMTTFRERLEPQLRAARMELGWRVGALPDLPGLHPAAVLGIYRILQEAVTNAIRHSDSPRIEVNAGASPLPGCTARIVVEDHGRGGAQDRLGGHGLGNMRRRAQGLGATLSIERTDGTTRVVLDLPARFAEPD